MKKIKKYALLVIGLMVFAASVFAWQPIPSPGQVSFIPHEDMDGNITYTEEANTAIIGLPTITVKTTTSAEDCKQEMLDHPDGYAATWVQATNSCYLFSED